MAPAMLGLRDALVLAALSPAASPHRFADRAVPRATARFIRTTTRARAIRAPSPAFLDPPERWILAAFLERLPDDPPQLIHAVTAESVMQLTPSDSEAQRP